MNVPVTGAEGQVQKFPQPTIYYQMSTRNKSFLEMHYFLKSRGIKNNKFMLALLDPDLAGIDPHDPNLPVQYKMKVLKEVQRNYWYFIREVVRVPSTGSPRGVPYLLNRGNLAYSFCSMLNLNIFLEMPRQVGKTMGAIIRYLWLYNFATASSSMAFMNKKNPDAKRNLDDLKTARDLLPTYLQMSQEFSEVNGKKKKVPSTVTNIQHPVNGNIIRTVPGAMNEMAAANLVRGQTITLWWADEWAFTKYNQIIYVNGIPALMRAFDNARKVGAPYGITITTTAGILATEEGVYAYDMLLNSTVFSEYWYDLSVDDIYSIIKNNINSDFVYIKFTYQQLGLGEQWFHDRCKAMQWNMVAIRREILLEWIDTPENSPFNQNDLEALRGMVHDPIRTILILNKYNFEIYDTIEITMSGIPVNPPIIGIDVSGGYRKDYTAIAVIDSKTTKLIASLKCNYISIPDLARATIWIVKSMMPNAIVNIERNGGFGASLISKLKEPGGIKNNLYYEIKDRVIEETSDSFGRIAKKKIKTKVYGLDSSRDVRDLLIEILKERMDRHKDKFVSPVLLDELSKMVVKRNGKVEHSDNSHDDLVFALLMALYVWYEGKHLKENFGIDKSVIRAEDDTVDENMGAGVTAAYEAKFVEIIEELELNSGSEQDTIEAMKNDLKILKQGMGITYEKFMQQQKGREEAFLRDMLQNKVARQAYSEYSQIPVEDLELQLNSNKYIIPDSVYTNFNLDPEEIEKQEIQKNMNFSKFDAGK